MARGLGLKEFQRQYTVMSTQVDDVGSFPLPSSVDRKVFNQAYRLARDALAEGRDPRKDVFVWENFCKVTLDSFKQKCLAGLDVVNSPQQDEGVKQGSDRIPWAIEKGTLLVDEK